MNIILLQTGPGSFESVAILIFCIEFIIALVIAYFFFRWVFSIKERVRQNDITINLLKLIAKKQGVADEEILRATNNVHKG